MLKGEKVKQAYKLTVRFDMKAITSYEVIIEDVKEDAPSTP
jgi:hypothetical protein